MSLRTCSVAVGVNGNAGKIITQSPQQPVFRTEIMPPVADAVGLVHHKIGDPYDL